MKTPEIERKAFEATQNTKVLFERIEYIESMNAYMPKHEFANNLIVMQSAERFNFGWSMWQASAQRSEEKLEGCVVVPVEPTDEIIRAMQQSKKQFCKASAQLMYSAIVEAARGENHV